MISLRVAIAQVDLTVGDLDANVALVHDHVGQAAAAEADLVVFPEMTLTGYPPEDLVLRRSFRTASVLALHRLAGRLADDGLGSVAVVLGYLDDDDGPRNAAAFVQGGAVLARYFKHHLPNYGVFDENRYFRPGVDFTVVRLRGVDIGLTICEDVWQDGGPFAAAAVAQTGALICINGSPYERDKDYVRLSLVQRRAREADSPIVYVNQVGGQDELVFDGGSFVVNRDGTLIARAPQFETGLFYLDLDVAEAHAQPAQLVEAMQASAVPMTLNHARAPLGRAPADRALLGRAAAAARAVTVPLLAIAEDLPDEDEVWQALVLGTRDYARKNGFTTVVLGVSGGIDSAVVATIAADALGGQSVYGIAMPSAYSSEHSLADAEELIRRIGGRYQVVDVEPMIRAFVDSLKLTGLAEENVQARVRGTTLMGASNQHGHLVLATGNKSELSVGYSTIYGDAVGGFAPIKDVPKSLVWRLARWRNGAAHARGKGPPIPENSISKPPSAELRPGQLDSDSLPDYELLDAVLSRYVDSDAGYAELVASGFEPELVGRIARMTDAAEWKRRQYPPGPKISLKAFGRDRRLPISNRWREPR